MDNRKELEDALATANLVLEAEEAALAAKLEKVFDSAITLDNIKVYCSYNYATIEVPIPGHSHGHEIKAYYSKSWDGGKRKLEINIGTFGSFDASMKPEVDFYVVAGQLAANLPKMQETFDAIDFKPFDDAHAAAWRAHNKLEAFDREIREAEEEKKCREVESKLVPGCKISCGPRPWNIDEIAKVTPKRVCFNSRGWYRKDDVVYNILKNDYWKFA